MLPLAIACIPWGVLTGALCVQAGLSPLQGQVMSLIVFAGAAQLSALTMIGSGVGLIPILGSTMVISSRHLLYSMLFRTYVAQMSLWQRIRMAFVLTDEMFAVSEADTRREQRFCERYALWSGFTFYILWNISTAAGIFAADRINDIDELGLEFAIAATFIAMTFDQIRRFPVLVTVMVSGVSAVLLHSVIPDAAILVSALLGMLAGYLSDDQTQRPSSTGAALSGDEP